MRASLIRTDIELDTAVEYTEQVIREHDSVCAEELTLILGSLLELIIHLKNDLEKKNGLNG